jgi:hypothetical protein
MFPVGCGFAGIDMRGIIAENVIDSLIMKSGFFSL